MKLMVSNKHQNMSETCLGLSSCHQDKYIWNHSKILHHQASQKARNPHKGNIGARGPPSVLPLQQILIKIYLAKTS